MAVPITVSWRRLTAWMKVTIALLVVYVLSLVIEVPIGLYMLVHQYGAASAIGPGVIEAIFVALMITFFIHGVRGRRWAYIGAMVVGVLHAILSASIYFNSSGPPLALAVYLTALPALLAIAAALAVLDLRRKAAN